MIHQIAKNLAIYYGIQISGYFFGRVIQYFTDKSQPRASGEAIVIEDNSLFSRRLFILESEDTTDRSVFEESSHVQDRENETQDPTKALSYGSLPSLDFFKSILLYSIEQEEGQPYALTLGQVNRALNVELNRVIMGIIKVNHNQHSFFRPFNDLILPNFRLGNLMLHSILFQYSVNNLGKPICVLYKKIFDYYLDDYIHSWLEHNCKIEEFDNYYELISKETSIKIARSRFESLFLIYRFFQVYVDCHSEKPAKFLHSFDKKDKFIQDFVSKCNLAKRFKGCSDRFTDYWNQCGFKLSKTGDTYNFKVHPNIGESFKIDSKDDSSIPHIMRLFERYLLSNWFRLHMAGTEMPEQQSLALEVITFIAQPYLKEKYSDILLNIVFHLYQECRHSIYPINLYILEKFIQNDLIDKDQVTEFLNLVIELLCDPSSSEEIQNASAIVLLQFLDRDLISEDKFNFLKTYIITRFGDPAFSLFQFQASFIHLLKQLLKKNADIQNYEASTLKNYANRSFYSSSLARQQNILTLLSFILKPSELFDIVSLKFFKDIQAYILENNPNYSTSTASELLCLYNLFIEHPYIEIQALAAKIVSYITSSINKTRCSDVVFTNEVFINVLYYSDWNTLRNLRRVSQAIYMLSMQSMSYLSPLMCKALIRFNIDELTSPKEHLQFALKHTSIHVSSIDIRHLDNPKLLSDLVRKTNLSLCFRLKNNTELEQLNAVLKSNSLSDEQQWILSIINELDLYNIDVENENVYEINTILGFFADKERAFQLRRIYFGLIKAKAALTLPDGLDKNCVISRVACR